MIKAPVRILLVEDEEAHSRVLDRAFRTGNDRWELTTASTLREAFTYLGEKTPDLIIADWTLPDGTAHELLTNAGETLPYPVIVMTAQGTQEIAVEAMKAGAFDYVTKSDTAFADMPHVAGRALREWKHITNRKKAERELRKSETLLNSIVDQSPFAMWISDDKGTLIRINDACLGITKLTRDEVVGIYNVLKDEAVEKQGLIPLVRSVFERGETVNFELVWDSGLLEHVEHRESVTLVLDVTIFPVKDADGTVTNAVVQHIDISERKEAEKRVLETTRQLQSVLDSISDGFFTLDKTFRVIYFNRAAQELLKRREEDVLGKNLFEVFPQAKGSIFEEKYIQALQNREFVAFETCFGSAPHEDWYDVRIFPYEKGISVYFRITTEQKKVEESLRESELRFRQLAENIDAAVWIGSPDWKTIFYISPAYERMWGKTCESLYQEPMSWFEAVLEEDREAVRASIRVKSSGQWSELPPLEYRIARPDGSIRWISARSFPVRDDKGNVIRVAGFLEETTERRALERQLLQAQKMESVGTLAGGVAHDFNNLLQIISGHAELMEVRLADQNIPLDELAAIRHASDRGAELVKRLLTFSRKVDARLTPVNLNEIIEEAEVLLYRTIPKMINIRTRLNYDLNTIEADPSQIEQVIINLALNAKQAMPDGGTLVFETNNVLLDEEFCKLHADCTLGEYVLLAVSDTGCGMNKDVLRRIFEPFFTTRKLGEGTGLGLSMVFGIVKMHSGLISCYSEPGEGTTFKIYFPVVQTGKTQQVGEEPDLPEGGEETILVVDDEPYIRELAKRILERSGYNILLAGTGQEALEIYKKERSKIALVILDLIMPEMGGRQCLEELLKIDPQVKALIASGFATEGNSREFLDAAAKGSVSKPFNIRELLNSVRTVLDGD